MTHLDLMDAYDDAHTLRKQLAYDLRANDSDSARRRLDSAMQAEENARFELEQFEREQSGQWA